jgi:ribosomal protein L17
VYNKPLEKDVKSDTSGNFRRLLVSLVQGNRPETTEVNVEQAKQDAQSLIDAGQAKFGTDEARFNVLFCNRSDPQLRAIFNEFAKLTGKSVGKVVGILLSCHIAFLFVSYQRKQLRAKQVAIRKEVS